jgi:hypothetical protein
MRRVHASGGSLGLLVSFFFALAVTSHGPAPAHRFAHRVAAAAGRGHKVRSLGSEARRPAAPPVTTHRPSEVFSFLAWERPRSSVRVALARVDGSPSGGGARRPRRIHDDAHDGHIAALATAYHEAHAPPASGTPASGRHSCLL